MGGLNPQTPLSLRHWLWRLFLSVLSRNKGLHQPWLLRRGCWKSAYCHQQCAAAVECLLWCISATATSVNKFPLRRCGKWWRVRLSKVPLIHRNSEGRRLKIGDNWSYATSVENFWLRHWLYRRYWPHHCEVKMWIERDSADEVTYIARVD